jgi:hypothetical protein
MSQQNISAPPEAILEILSTVTIRDRAQKIYDLAKKGGTHFKIDESRLPFAAQLTSDVTRENYPQLDIPFHSRWKHFNVGGLPRVSALQALLSEMNPLERAQSKLDLVIVSVLLDAGAGMKWKYLEKGSDTPFSKSEGLAVASLHMFLAGAFSSDRSKPFQVDAEGLEKLSWASFASHFQISDQNPLSGDRGRFELLKNLGKVLTTQKEFFVSKKPRPGDLASYLSKSKKIEATDILSALQNSLGAIWPGRVNINGFNVGDVWPYPPLGEGLKGLVPFHKLSQWLTYSMVDPLVELGVKIEGFDKLTALAEYRNGGLLVDSGILELRDPSLLSKSHHPSSELVIEWRALTIVLMEKLATGVRSILGKTESELPLGKVLEGGTWWAGRKIAAHKRLDGGPPIQIESDGTVF